MKKLMTLIVSVFVVFAFSGFSFSLTGKAEASTKNTKSLEKMNRKYVTGEITAIDSVACNVTVKDKDGDKIFSAGKKCHVVINGKRKTLADLEVGKTVTVRYKIAQNKNVATRINLLK